MVLTGFEKGLSRQSWRSLRDSQDLPQPTRRVGYTLSDVERIITDHGTDPDAQARAEDPDAG